MADAEEDVADAVEEVAATPEPAAEAAPDAPAAATAGAGTGAIVDAPEEHVHDESDYGKRVVRDPLCVICTGTDKSDGHIRYQLDVMQGGTQVSGQFNPMGGTKVNTVGLRYSDFDELRVKLKRRFAEIGLIAFPKKYMYGNGSESVVAERTKALEKWMNFVLRTPSAAVQEASDIAQLLMPLGQGDAAAKTFGAIFATGKVAWVETLVSDAATYEFSHKHRLQEGSHSHTFEGKDAVMKALDKTSRTWNLVSLVKTEALSETQYRNTYNYQRLGAAFECVETLEVGDSGLIDTITRNRT